MAPRGRTLLLPLAAATVLVASTIFLFAAVGARWRPADTGLPVPPDAFPTAVTIALPNATTGKELSFLDENGRPDDSSSASASGATAVRCDPRAAAVRVFMYDMPPEFHFGLLGWSPPSPASVWPDVTDGSLPPPRYPGGLNQQHSVEYWLTLDLLSSSSRPPLRSACHRPPRRRPRLRPLLRVPQLQPPLPALAAREGRQGQGTPGEAGGVPHGAAGMEEVRRSRPRHRGAPPQQLAARPGGVVPRSVRAVRLREVPTEGGQLGEGCHCAIQAHGQDVRQ
ncbi:Exostosin family protein [Zea mays]|uniref:Exostosin family protein n=1 Tax=Zea mays TaxID=4577 RepID=A0A1D6NQK0_MAIZE|nr:Exostosin family protein [Zea mays]